MVERLKRKVQLCYLTTKGHKAEKKLTAVILEDISGNSVSLCEVG